jgi:hypothetical protein
MPRFINRIFDRVSAKDATPVNTYEGITSDGGALSCAAPAKPKSPTSERLLVAITLSRTAVPMSVNAGRDQCLDSTNEVGLASLDGIDSTGSPPAAYRQRGLGKAT